MIINSHENFEADIWEPIIPTISPDVFLNVTDANITTFNSIQELHGRHNVHYCVFGYTLAIIITLIMTVLWSQRSKNGKINGKNGCSQIILSLIVLNKKKLVT